MNVKDYLDQIRNIELEINCLDSQRRNLNSDIQATRFEHDKSYSNVITRPPEDLIVRMENLDETVSERQLKLVELKGTIAREIDQVSIENFRVLLNYRYVQSMEWKEVSKKMGYTVRHLDNIHRNALKEFKKEHKNKVFT